MPALSQQFQHPAEWTQKPSRHYQWGIINAHFECCCYCCSRVQIGSGLAWSGLQTIRTPQLEQIIDINRSRELSKLISNAFSQKIIDDDDGNDEDDYAQC